MQYTRFARGFPDDDGHGSSGQLALSALKCVGDARHCQGGDVTKRP